MKLFSKGINLHVDVPSVETQKLVDTKSKAENSKEVQRRVQGARNIQIKRFKGTKLRSNSEMTTRNVKEYCPLPHQCRTMLLSAAATMNLSARSYFKVIKIACTIADLENVKEISTNNLAEALQYRPKESEF